ncbi:MAG: xanthine dehydrogenase family protein molybdopterin-binding subunit [Terracidiphilus sp.]|jgi:CO/xanthine dehydrogenase Mo-binding subunit
MRNTSPTRIVGTPALRKEGIGKVTGSARYIDDISLPGMWHGATVRSSIARGIIKEIRFGVGIAWDEFVIVTAKDIPGTNRIPLIVDHDQPVLAERQVNHPEEAVVLLAHPDKARLHEAVAAVEIDYEPLPTVFTIEESERQQTIVWGKDNVIKRFLVEKGDVDSAWKRAAHIVTGEYHTGAQEQLYIENNGVIADWSEADGLTIRGSMQCPYYVHRALLRVFDLPAEKVRVIQAETGGAFGGKEDYPSMIAAHAGLLAKKAGRPVKIIYDREEDLAATTKRHPSRTRYRTAVDKDGRLLAMDIQVDLDGGAYATVSPTVLSRATIHASGPYFCDNIRIRSRAWATNLPPHGAFRGFGTPQTIFGIERHMDQIAKTVGISPDDVRRRNFLAQGKTTATGQEIRDAIDLPGMLDRALKVSDYKSKHLRFARENAASSVIKRGIGMASFMHGAGFTGSGERYLNSLVGLEADAAGHVTVLVSSTEFGQGTNTILSQIAAEALGLPYEDVSIAQPDTQRVPNSGPTVASRTTMIVGKLVKDAAHALAGKLREKKLLGEKFSATEFRAACTAYIKRYGALRAEARYQAPKDIFWDDAAYKGEAYPAFAWAVYVAEVAVDMRTYSTQVVNFYAVQEVGRVVNPLLAAGQIEGGVAQGVGYALYEKVVWKNGRMSNSQMTNYIMPTAVDVPNIEVYFEESPCEHGPYGAKGLGELPHDGPAPAILNAIQDATGINFTSIPLLPEDMYLRMVETPETVALETAGCGERPK